MSRHAPIVRTSLIFTSVVDHVLYDIPRQMVTVQLRDDKVAYSKIDADCNILSGAIDKAFHSLDDAPLVTLVTPFEIITNIPLTDKKLSTVKPIFSKAYQRVEFSFAGSHNDADKLRRGTSFQIYAVDLNLPCPTVQV